jgi:hypothetical protein
VAVLDSRIQALEEEKALHRTPKRAKEMSKRLKSRVTGNASSTFFEFLTFFSLELLNERKEQLDFSPKIGMSSLENKEVLLAILDSEI